MIYTVYILYSEAFDRFYYGQTQDIALRLTKHNSGTEPSTKNYIPWKLHAYKEFESRSAAMKVEKSIKNQKSRIRVSEYLKNKDFIFEI